MALVWSLAAPTNFACADEVTAGLAQAHQMMQKGAYAKAIDIITNVIASGKAQADMAAKALLMRGQAREKLGKKAFALADYNQALWMQGLSEQDKKLAEAGRARIQGGLGVNQSSKTMVSEVSRPQRTSAPAPTPSRSRSFSSAPAPSPSPPSLASGRSMPMASSQMRSTSLGFDQSPPPQQSSGSSSGGGIGGFFSSLFGSSESSTPSHQEQTTAVAVVSPQVRPAPQQRQRRQTRSQPTRAASNVPTNVSRSNASTSWDSQTAQATTASTGSSIDRMKGHFAIQFAALLSEDKAIYEVNRVTRRYGDSLEGRSPSIRIVGTKEGDTLYKIIAGPYETMAESTAKCNELKTVGVQCMVITIK
ncbi:MAG: SPOR domain-containing protein [Alphaproteobacteria bacterium]